MVDFGNLITTGILATAVPTLLGILIAYSIIAVVLGAFLWVAKSVPDDIGTALILSGLTIAVLLAGGLLFLRLFLA